MVGSTAPLAFFGLGPTEMIVIGVLALLLFGPRLPKVMRSLGRGIVEFKKGIRDTEDAVDRQISAGSESDEDRESNDAPDA